MCTILRKDIWSYWTVVMAWLKLIIWRHLQFHLTLLDSFTWCFWTVSPDVTGQFHLALLNRITWCYWTVSLGVTEPHHLMLLDSFTWRYWAVSHDVTGQFHLSLLNLLDSCILCYWNYHLTLQCSNRAVQCATINSLICDCFLKSLLSKWQTSQWHSKISWSIFSK